jgi:FAD/FMN-containing dehydrogenase
MFGAQQGVVIEGNFSRKKDLPISRFGRAEDEWFYLHVKENALGNESYEELLPTEDYFFRYNRGAFWTGRHVFDLLHLPFTKFLRTQLDRGFRTKNMYELLHVTDLSQRYIIQDICLPEESATEFMRYIDQEHDIQPLWILPIKPDKKTLFSPSHIDTDLVINVGVWGKVNNNNFDDYMDANRDLERVVQSLGGRKVLYAQHYYSQDEFWDMYDKDQYLLLREKYNADIFPDIHDKTVVTEDYNPSIARGFIHVFKKLFSK